MLLACRLHAVRNLFVVCVNSCLRALLPAALARASCRSHLLHYIVIVAAEDIPKYTELTYDYGSMYIVQGDVSAVQLTLTQSALHL
jgi:hypothetical protein